MTRPTSARSNNSNPVPSPTAAAAASTTRRAAAFTLVELLVVIGIIVLLIGLLTPMISRAYRNAERSRAAADMQAIATALEAYKVDFGSYPVPARNPDWATNAANSDRPNPMTGAQLLCQALIGPASANDPQMPVTGTLRPRQDGADGPGFRVQRTAGPDGVMNTTDDNLQSKVYPPYLPAEKFKVADPLQPGTAIVPETALKAVILDRFRMPILYYPAVGNPNIRAAAVGGHGWYASPANPALNLKPRYNHEHNPPALNPADTTKKYAPELPEFRFLLGDFHGPSTGSPPDGVIQMDETPTATGPYVLWSAGPDEIFGPLKETGGDVNALDPADVPKTDDITNFRQ